MSDRTTVAVCALVVTAVSLVTSAYETYLGAPAAVAARPELADLPFWTAVFSGRFASWLYYTHPLEATIVTAVLAAIGGTLVGVLLSDGGV